MENFNDIEELELFYELVINNEILFDSEEEIYLNKQFVGIEGDLNKELLNDLIFYLKETEQYKKLQNLKNLNLI